MKKVEELKTNRDLLENVSAYIERKVAEDHQGRKSWNKSTGQWLVYGFEGKLGFGYAVELESFVETAYRKKESVRDAALSVLLRAYVNAGVDLEAPLKR